MIKIDYGLIDCSAIQTFILKTGLIDYVTIFNSLFRRDAS